MIQLASAGLCTDVPSVGGIPGRHSEDQHSRLTLRRVSTYLKGAFDLVATLVSKEDWNQPPSWSFPSRYKSALCSVPEMNTNKAS